jgi:hypothetical protein
MHARVARVVVTSSAAALVCVVAVAAPASATPPNIPSYSTAVTRLNTLTVTAESHQSSYDRDLFPHWITISGSCNTREEVLKRDGTNVSVNGSCSDLWIMVQPLRRRHLGQPRRCGHRSHGSAGRGVALRRLGLDNITAPDLRQRPRRAGGVGRHRQRQPVQGRPGPRSVATTARSVPLHLRPGLDPGQVVLQPHRRLRREVRPYRHAQHLLTPQAGRPCQPQYCRAAIRSVTAV